MVSLVYETLDKLPGVSELSIDGFEETGYDSDNIRQGRCIVHASTGDIPIDFLVEWGGINSKSPTWCDSPNEAFVRRDAKGVSDLLYLPTLTRP